MTGRPHPPTATTRQLVQSLLENADRLGLRWRPRPATIVPGAPAGRTHAVLDGDTTPIRIVSLVGGPLVPGTRVMGLIVPPAGTYAVGFIGPVTPGGGPDAVASSETSSDPVGTAPAVVLSVPFTFRGLAAYRVTLGGGVQSSAAGVLADFRLRTAAGTQITEFYRWRTEGSPVINTDAVRYLRRTATSDLTTAAQLTLAASSGTVTHVGLPGRPRFLEIHRCGHAAAYPHAATVT